MAVPRQHLGRMIRRTRFAVTSRGFDRDEVLVFLNDLANSLEASEADTRIEIVERALEIAEQALRVNRSDLALEALEIAHSSGWRTAA